MNELEDYKEEKPEPQTIVVKEKEPIIADKKETPKKKMSITVKIFICLVIFCLCFMLFKMNYKPKSKKVLPPPELIPGAAIVSNVYDLKSEVSKFLQKQVEYIM
jgi:hypothetical protein